MSEGSESFMTPNLHVPTEWLMTCSTVYRGRGRARRRSRSSRGRDRLLYPLMIYFD